MAMTKATAAPFAGFEWAIAWRYLKARRAEGGVSVMSIISLVGVALAVFALIAVLAVRTGFREQFVATILGANAHATVYAATHEDEFGLPTRKLWDFDAEAERIRAVPGVIRAAPVVKGQVMASANGRNAGVEVFGERAEDLATLPLVAHPEASQGSLADYGDGVAIGAVLARDLGLLVGDTVTLISPDGVQTPGGAAPRVNAYAVTYIFEVGRYDIDKTRIYMPLAEAQSFFNSEGAADEIEVMVAEPEEVARLIPALLEAGGPHSLAWTWQDASGGFLRALQMEDNIMFVIMAVLVLVATLNIISGLIMLVKNKGRDIGILRTMGLSQGSILRVFFICGASIGLVGTAIGVVLGSLFAIYIDPIFDAVNYILGGGVWDPSVRFLSKLPAKLEVADVLKAVGLSLGLSFVITLFPARRAARMNPVEALRYE